MSLNTTYFWGQHDLYWVAFYDIPERLGIVTYDAEASRRLKLWADLGRSCGWWWPFAGVCVMSERPAEVHMEPWPGRGDAALRLHRADGPVLRYRDGWTVHSWHGTRVPQDLIETNWTLEQVLAERNAEIRRCAIEKIGWDVFVADYGLREVASAPDPGNHPHTIALYDLPDGLRNMYDQPARILLCTNGTVEPDGTRRRFGLPVPAHHTDPVAAAAELYGWPRDVYARLQVRR